MPRKDQTADHSKEDILVLMDSFSLQATSGWCKQVISCHRRLPTGLQTGEELTAIKESIFIRKNAQKMGVRYHQRNGSVGIAVQARGLGAFRAKKVQGPDFVQQLQYSSFSCVCWTCARTLLESLSKR